MQSNKKSVRDVAEVRLNGVADYINKSLSHESAEGNASFEIKGEAGAWKIELSGSVCSGYDNDGIAIFRDADELFGKDSWSGTALLSVVDEVERDAGRAKGYE